MIHPLPSWSKAGTAKAFGRDLIQYDHAHGGAFSNPPYENTKLIALAQAMEAVDDLPAGLLCAIADVESGWRPSVIGDKGASFGLCQVQLATARSEFHFVGNAVVLCHPVINLGMASGYLQRLRHTIGAAKTYGGHGDWKLAIAAYNCGPGCVARAFKDYPTTMLLDEPAWHNCWSRLPKSTQRYVDLVITLQAQYATEHAFEDRNPYAGYNSNGEGIRRAKPRF